MKEITITVKPRIGGKGPTKKLRRQSMVPAVVYGPKIKNQSFYTDEKAVQKYLRSGFENAIFTLVSDYGPLNQIKVLLKNLQIHPVTRRPLHIDFFALDETSTVRVRVEIRVEGKPKGLGEGGVLTIILRDIEVECLPTAIPEYILADVSHLGVNETLHLSDLSLPKEVKVMVQNDLAVATVVTIKEEAVVTAEAQTAEAAAAALAAPGGTAAPAAGGGAQGASTPGSSSTKSDDKKR